MIAKFACVLHSIITVPMYCLFSDREIIFVINNTKLAAIICDRVMLPTFLRLYSKCPTLRHLICMDPIPDSIIRKFKPFGLLLFTSYRTPTPSEFNLIGNSVRTIID
jgi:long-subunit acyl-CoA synthetase (AMP-forming)